MKHIALACLLLAPDVASAQDVPSDRAPFAGPYGGIEAGVQDHGFTLETTDGFGTTDKHSYDRAGFAAGLFAGYDWAISRRIRLGVEATGNVGGGRGGRADLPGGGRFELRPRWGANAVGRAGYVLGGTLLYGTVGYGGYKYRVRTDRFVTGAKEWNDGVVYGGGVETRLSPRVSARFDIRILDGQAAQLLVGVPIRF